MSPEFLTELLQTRNQKSLAILYDRYGAALFGIIYRIVESETAAEEVLQQTFLQVWDQLDVYETKHCSLFTWMSQIARQTAKEAKNDKIEQVTTSNMVVDEALSSPAKWTVSEITTLLDQLDEEDRIVVEYIYLKGHTHTEASHQFSIPLDTVKTRLRNAIVKLQSLLRDERGVLDN